MKLALVYDWANQFGGGERVAEAVAEIFPQIDLFTLIYDPTKARWSKNFNQIKTSFLQRFPFVKNKYFLYFPLFPFAFEEFDFTGYDLVISLTSLFAKGIITPPETCHLCYCLTPPRFLWERKSLSLPWQKFFFLAEKWREEDYLLSRRPDFYLTTCKNVARRIEKFYRRSAEIVYPGVDLKRFVPSSREKEGDFFLWVGRLVEYKRVDLLVETFNQWGERLVIIGRGRMEKKLKKMAKKNIEFWGEVEEKRLIQAYQNCRAVIYPQEEDFGLVPLEAQACGKPVIAFARGGARETIIPGKTGEFFSSQKKADLLKLLYHFQPKNYRPEECRRQAARFSKKRFMNSFKKTVLAKYEIFLKRKGEK